MQTIITSGISTKGQRDDQQVSPTNPGSAFPMTSAASLPFRVVPPPPSLYRTKKENHSKRCLLLVAETNLFVRDARNNNHETTPVCVVRLLFGGGHFG
ncbi:hypothetical protein JTE90_008117 [Oedothorax gibbosus]|uniref:Uncharacterized protein n=1 Tax=Oedothorax gibbosus TaxID=931172 RepID=A0AAV6UG44_9ARAC|nr:hypothetical protein JTE90_008117 [Oedothorax gibbosus]